jgi:hypothetical protein
MRNRTKTKQKARQGRGTTSHRWAQTHEVH